MSEDENQTQPQSVPIADQAPLAAPSRAAPSVTGHVRMLRFLAWTQPVLAFVTFFVLAWLGVDNVAGKLASASREAARSQAHAQLTGAMGAAQVDGRALRAWGRGVSAMGQGESLLAVSLFEEAARFDSSSRVFQSWLARARLAAGDAHGAARAGEAALALAGETAAPGDTIVLATSYCQLGEMERARRLLSDGFARAHGAAIIANAALLDTCGPINHAVLAAMGETRGLAARYYKITSLALHVHALADIEAGRAIAQGLCAAGYGVTEVSIAPAPDYPATGLIQYGAQAQQIEALTIAAAVVGLAREQGGPEAWASAVPAKRLAGFADPMIERAYVWLAPGGGEAEAGEDAAPFSCAPGA